MNFIFLSLSLFLPIAAEGLGLAHSSIRPSIYRNPVIPGWNSDPSCTFVAEHNCAILLHHIVFLGLSWNSYLRKQGPRELETG
jgi:hypothetical protein